MIIIRKVHLVNNKYIYYLVGAKGERENYPSLFKSINTGTSNGSLSCSVLGQKWTWPIGGLMPEQLAKTIK